LNIIPIQQDPYYRFDIVIEGSQYELIFIYNTRADYWSVSVTGETGIIASGVPFLSIDGIFDQYNIGVDGLTPLDLASSGDPNLANVAEVVLFQLNEAERYAAIK